MGCVKSGSFESPAAFAHLFNTVQASGINAESGLPRFRVAFFASMGTSDASNRKGFVFKILRLLAAGPEAGTTLRERTYQDRVRSQFSARGNPERKLTPVKHRQRNYRVRKSALKCILSLSCLSLMCLAATGCQKKQAAPAGAGMQAMPVRTMAVSLSPVAQSSEFEATIK